jgi:hypothetical protein
MTAPAPRLPIAAQFIEQAQQQLPREACVDLGSSAFRAALKDFAETLPVYLLPTRRETAQAIMQLRALGRLAPWMGKS